MLLLIFLFVGNASVWNQQHTIYYRPIEDDQTTANNKAASSSASTTRKSGKSSSASKLIRKKTEFWTEGTIPAIVSPLTQFLTSALPMDVVTVQDASLDALCMLRIVNALNRNWSSLYDCVRHEQIIPQSEFIHSKVSGSSRNLLCFCSNSNMIVVFFFLDCCQGESPTTRSPGDNDRKPPTMAPTDCHRVSVPVSVRDTTFAFLCDCF